MMTLRLRAGEGQTSWCLGLGPISKDTNASVLRTRPAPAQQCALTWASCTLGCDLAISDSRMGFVSYSSGSREIVGLWVWISDIF